MGRTIQYRVIFAVAFVVISVVAGCGGGTGSSQPNFALVGIWASASKDVATVDCHSSSTSNGNNGIFRLFSSCKGGDTLTYRSNGTFTFSPAEYTTGSEGDSKGTYTYNQATGSMKLFVTGASTLEAKAQISADDTILTITPIVKGVDGPTITLSRQPDPSLVQLGHLFDPHY